MARTRGTARLELPASVDLGLRNLGFVPFTVAGTIASKGTHTFCLLQRPTFVLQLVASNIPGESAVVATWPGFPPDRIEADAVLLLLEHEVKRVLSPSQKAADILDQIGYGQGSANG